MNRIVHYIALGLLLLGLLATTGCDPTKDIPPLGEPASKLEGINDSFRLSKVVQTDEITQIPSNRELDITDFFVRQDPPVITFDSQNFTYTYSQGDAPTNIFGDAGTWEFINASAPQLSNEFPEQLMLTSDTGEDFVLELLQTIRPVEMTLEVKLVKTCGGSPSVGYQFVFERQ